MTDAGWWTEEDWLCCTDPGRMVEALERRAGADRRALASSDPLIPPPWRGASPRLLRLGLGAAYRLTWDALTPQAQAAVVAVEEYADGAIPYARVAEVKRSLWSQVYPRQPVGPGEADAFTQDAARTLRDALDGRPELYHRAVAMRPSPALAAVILDLFGNPFRPVTPDPSWLTPTVVAIASGIYADRAFDRLPVLADALEDTGCCHADLLIHCRSGGPHVRGCWAVDLTLGKQ